MNLGELKSQLEILVPEFPASDYVAEILQWFNTAQREVADKKIISDRAVALSDTDATAYSLPGNFIDFKRRGVFVDGKKIDPITLTQLVSLYGEGWKSLGRSTPKYYLREGGIIEFIPDFDTNGKEIALYYWAYPNDLSANDDLPFTTGNPTDGYGYHNHLRNFDELLLEYAVSMAKFTLGFYSTTQQALTNFYSLLNSKVAEIKKREDLYVDNIQPDPYLLKKKQQRGG